MRWCILNGWPMHLRGLAYLGGPTMLAALVLATRQKPWQGDAEILPEYIPSTDIVGAIRADLRADSFPRVAPENIRIR
jgi:hypothetical protein